MPVTVIERARVAALVLRDQLPDELKRRAKSTRRAIPLGVLKGKEGMGRAVDAQAAQMDVWLIEQGVDDALVERVHRDGDAMWMGIAFLHDLLLELDEADQKVLRPWLAPPLPDVPENVLRGIIGKQRLADFHSRPGKTARTEAQETLASMNERADHAGRKLMRRRS